MPTDYREVDHPRNADGTWKDKAQRGRPDVGFAALGEYPAERIRRVRGWPLAAELVCDTTAWAPAQQRLVWARWERRLADEDLGPAALRSIGSSIANCYVNVDRSDIHWPSPEARNAAIEDAADAFGDSLSDSLSSGGCRPGDRLPRALDEVLRVVGSAAEPDKPILRHSLREGANVESSRQPMLSALAAMASGYGSTDPARWQSEREVITAYRDIRAEMSEQHHPAPERQHPAPDPEQRLLYDTAEDEFQARLTELQAAAHKQAGDNLAEWLAADPDRLASLAEPVGAFLASRAFKTGEGAAMYAEYVSHYRDRPPGQPAFMAGRPGFSRDQPYEESPNAQVYDTAKRLAGDDPDQVRLICDSIHERRAAYAGNWHFQRTWRQESGLPAGERLEASLRASAVAAADSLYQSGLFTSAEWPWPYLDLNRAQTGLALMFSRHQDEELDGLLGSGGGGAAALNGGLCRTPVQFFLAADDYSRATNNGAFLPDWEEGTVNEARVLDRPLAASA